MEVSLSNRVDETRQALLEVGVKLWIGDSNDIKEGE